MDHSHAHAAPPGAAAEVDPVCGMTVDPATAPASVAHGGREWTREDLRPRAGLRLYQATADAHSILAKDGQPDRRP